MEVSQSPLKKCKVACMEILQSPLKKHVNWLELQQDIILIILMKLGHLDILKSAQFVCKLWYNLCKEPLLWRTVNFRDIVDDEKKALNVIDRSAGGLIDLDIEGFGSDDIVSYIASRSSKLKRLRIANCHLSAKVLADALKQLSSLEELELTHCRFKPNKKVCIINSCPSLITFKLNGLGSSDTAMACNLEAEAIAGNMPEIRHLQVIGNNMTNDGLTTILEACSHLKFLDLRACFQLDLKGNLGKRLSEKIEDLRLPSDSTEDYGYPTTDYNSDDDVCYCCFHHWED